MKQGQEESLADYVRRVRTEKGLSLKDVEKKSGGDISNGYISRIENGYITNPTPKKLRALARGLGVPENKLIELVTGAARQAEEEDQDEEIAALFYRYKQLSPKDKEALRSLLEVVDREIDRRLGKQ